MNDKTEWEVLDRPGHGRKLRAGDLLRAVLGPNWRWKLAGIAVAAAALLTVGVLVAGVFFVGLVVVAMALLIALQLRHWTERAYRAFHNRRSNGQVVRKEYAEEFHAPNTPPRQDWRE